jgi:hypothetical protein
VRVPGLPEISEVCISCGVDNDASNWVTVIATGFKDSDHRRRRQEEPSSFVISRESSRHDDFLDDPQPEAELDPEPTSPPMVMQQSAPQATAGVAASESTSIDSMRNAMIANFEQSDLDVPAFLRKRSETM